MFRMNNSGKLYLSKKVFIILTGSVLLVALIGWVVLVSGLLEKDKKPDGEEKSKNGTFTSKEPKYEFPEVPDGYVMVFRQTSRYEVADNGVRTLRAEMEYDEYGREISETVYDIEGAFSHREVYEYDERGNVIKQAEYDESGFVLYMWEAVYNEQGVMIERRDNALRDYFDDNGNLLYEKYILDWHGFLEQMEHLLSEEDDTLRKAACIYILQVFYRVRWDPEREFYPQYHERMDAARSHFGFA